MSGLRGNQAGQAASFPQSGERPAGRDEGRCNVLGMPYCRKPKWMRQRMYRRLVGVIRECHEHQVTYMVQRRGHLAG